MPEPAPPSLPSGGPPEDDAQPTFDPAQKRLMQAMVAACALIANADGRIDAVERARVLRLLRTVPPMAGFPARELAAEFDRHERQLDFEPYSARDKALDAIEALQANATEARLLLSACQTVLEADGVAHPAEYEALSRIGRALAGSWP